MSVAHSHSMGSGPSYKPLSAFDVWISSLDSAYWAIEQKY